MFNKGAHRKTLEQHWKDGRPGYKLGRMKTHQGKESLNMNLNKQALTSFLKFSQYQGDNHFVGLFSNRGKRSNSELVGLDHVSYEFISSFYFAWGS